MAKLKDQGLDDLFKFHDFSLFHVFKNYDSLLLNSLEISLWSTTLLEILLLITKLQETTTCIFTMSTART